MADAQPGRKLYGCTVCLRALTAVQAWVIYLPHDDCRYRCERHKENGRPVVSR